MVACAEYGGIDASPLTAAVVSEEIGRAAAALPFEMHSVALRLLSDAGPLKEFEGITNGVLTAAFAGLSAEKFAFSLVPEGAICDAILLPVDGHLLIAREFERHHVATMGMNRSANITIDRARAETGHAISSEAVAGARTFATVLFTSKMVGLGDWMLSQCAAYAGSRVQFGRPIGSFQAIQHKLADMHIAMTASRFLARHAAMALQEGRDGRIEAARAKAFTGAGLWRVGTEAHQIHGGVGFVLDHPLHLYFSQARGADSLFGATREHHESVGKAILTGDGFAPNAMLGVV
jgi:alkylation response protein AidB-like acyl-CoA dehydrogenase